MGMSHRLLRPRSKKGGYDFRTISNLVWWLDGSDTSTMSQNSDGTGSVAITGDPVARINNKASSSFNATQTTNNLRPTLLTNGMGGRSVLSVSSTASSGYVVPKITSASSCTYFFVGKYTGSNNWLTLWSVDAFCDAANASQLSAPYAASGSPSYRVNKTSISATRQALYNAAQPNNFLLTVTSIDMSAVNTNWGASEWSFLNYPSTFKFIGNVAEVLLYARGLSGSEITTVETELALKWGLP